MNLNIDGYISGSWALFSSNVCSCQNFAEKPKFSCTALPWITEMEETNISQHFQHQCNVVFRRCEKQTQGSDIGRSWMNKKNWKSTVLRRLLEQWKSMFSLWWDSTYKVYAMPCGNITLLIICIHFVSFDVCVLLFLELVCGCVFVKWCSCLTSGFCSFLW